MNYTFLVKLVTLHKIFQNRTYSYVYVFPMQWSKNHHRLVLCLKLRDTIPWQTLTIAKGFGFKFRAYQDRFRQSRGPRALLSLATQLRAL